MRQAVFIPGLLCTGEVFAPQRAALVDAFEISIADHIRDDSIEGIAETILAAAPERFVMVGHSLGGIIGQEVMAQQPERVEALVLIDTSARADTSEQAARRIGFIDFAEYQGLPVAMAKTLPLMLHESRLQDPDLKDVLVRMAEACGIGVFKRQQAALAGRRDYRGADLAAITSPTLVIVGEADAMTPLDLSRKLPRASPAPASRWSPIAAIWRCLNVQIKSTG